MEKDKIVLHTSYEMYTANLAEKHDLCCLTKSHVMLSGFKANNTKFKARPFKHNTLPIDLKISELVGL